MKLQIYKYNYITTYIYIDNYIYIYVYINKIIHIYIFILYIVCIHNGKLRTMHPPKSGGTSGITQLGIAAGMICEFHAAGATVSVLMLQ